MNARPEKILALQFKYFGDAVLMTPALRALRKHFPGAELHLLVPEEIAPIFRHLPWLNRVWAMPRRRGRAALRQTWPLLRALRREHFDRSVDFAGNDRSAILSFLAGARERLGPDEPGGFLGRRLCYNQRARPTPLGEHESLRLARRLSIWEVPPPDLVEPEIRADPALAEVAEGILPQKNAVLCHVASSQPKKEWPLARWIELNARARSAGLHPVFTTPMGRREMALVEELKKLAPDAVILPQIADLPLFLAVLLRASVFISGDTGPLHFAAGLGVPTISLFGPSSPQRWAPTGGRHRVLTGSPCSCDGNLPICQSAHFCLANISTEAVFQCLQAVAGSARG